MQQVQLAMFGIWELVLILAIVLVIFGAAKLPMLGESLGKGIRNFRRSFKDEPKQVDGQAERVEEGGNPEQLSCATEVREAQVIEKETVETDQRLPRS
jgi:sec-independent protein translocase protein TatA